MATNKPRILIFDTEATDLSANLGYMVAFAWKWIGGKTKYKTVLDFPSGPQFDPVYADRALCEHVRTILESADMWVTWYGKNHDIPFIRSRYLINGLKDFSDAAHFDGWEIAKKRLKFSRNGLDTVFNALGTTPKEVERGKVPVHIHHWLRARVGDAQAIREIAKKGRDDVNKLQQVFERLSPYSGSLLPNLYFENGEPGRPGWRTICPSCGGKSIAKWGFMFRNQSALQRYKCNGCGHNFTGKIENEKKGSTESVGG